MESMEIVIYLGFAVILGVLVLGMITGWDYFGMYGGFKKMMMPQQNVEFEKVDSSEFAGKVYELFRECTETQENRTMSLYLKDSGTYTKQQLFDTYKALSWCETIQSAENSCGHREDVSMGSISIPRVVRIACANNSLTIT
jgi:hypothetical protein